MSANRANAAARNRRAGGAEMPPPQQNSRPGQRPGQQSQAQVQTPQNPKISVSDAIGLVSLRIGRLEQFMYKINHEGIPSDESDFNLGENDRIVDEDVFRSIVSRIEALEKNIQTVQTSTSGPSLSADHPVIKGLVEKQNQQQLGIYEVKDLILKMQAFAMETSTSLKSLIEQYESDKEYYEQENNNGFLDSHSVDFAVPSEVIDDNNLTIDGDTLKELIKQELSNESL